MSRKTAMPVSDLFYEKCREAAGMGGSAVYVGDGVLEEMRKEWLEAVKNGETSFTPLDPTTRETAKVAAKLLAPPVDLDDESLVALCYGVFSYRDPNLGDGIEIRPIA